MVGCSGNQRISGVHDGDVLNGKVEVLLTTTSKAMQPSPMGPQKERVCRKAML